MRCSFFAFPALPIYSCCLVIGFLYLSLRYRAPPPHSPRASSPYVPLNPHLHLCPSCLGHHADWFSWFAVPPVTGAGGLEQQRRRLSPVVHSHLIVGAASDVSAGSSGNVCRSNGAPKIQRGKGRTVCRYGGPNNVKAGRFPKVIKIKTRYLYSNALFPNQECIHFSRGLCRQYCD